MPCDISLLERGAVCLALYPYTTGVPLDQVVREVEDEFLARLERHESVESIAKLIRQEGTVDIAVTMKMRRVLLLQSGTEAGRQDMLVARINSITERKIAAGANWYRKLQNGIHVAHLLIGTEDRHGTGGKEAYVDAMHVSPIQKSTILQRMGALDEHEMREVSDRLLRTLELDISAQLRNAVEAALRGQ